METSSDSPAPPGATPVEELAPPHLPETPTINEEPSTRNDDSQPITGQQETPLTEQSIRRILEELLDRRLGALIQPNRRRMRGEENRTRLTTEAMNALACNRTSQSEQLLTDNTEQSVLQSAQSSSQPGPNTNRRRSSDTRGTSSFFFFIFPFFFFFLILIVLFFLLNFFTFTSLFCIGRLRIAIGICVWKVNKN